MGLGPDASRDVCIALERRGPSLVVDQEQGLKVPQGWLLVACTLGTGTLALATAQQLSSPVRCYWYCYWVEPPCSSEADPGNQLVIAHEEYASDPPNLTRCTLTVCERVRETTSGAAPEACDCDKLGERSGDEAHRSRGAPEQRMVGPREGKAATGGGGSSKLATVQGIPMVPTGTTGRMFLSQTGVGELASSGWVRAYVRERKGALARVSCGAGNDSDITSGRSAVPWTRADDECEE